MIKRFVLPALLSLLTIGCTTDDNNAVAGGSNPDNNKVPTGFMIPVKNIEIGDGAVLSFGKSKIVTNPLADPTPDSRATTSVSNVACFGDSRHQTHSNIKIEDVYLNDVDVTGLAKLFCAEFIEMRANLKYAHPALSDMTTDFNYVSNGLPVEVMLLYTGTSTDTKLHLYYYDKNGDIHIQQLWAMDTEWKKSDETNTFQRFARINKDNKAWRFTLPQGTEFGFMMRGISTSNETKNKIEYHYTRMDENLLHPCEAVPQVNFPSAVQFKLTGNTYSGTFKGKPYTLDKSKFEGKTFIGFNNQFGSVTDYDYNDMILMVTPTPDIRDYETPEVTIEIGQPIGMDFVCESDDTNIRFRMDPNINEFVPISKIDNAYGLMLQSGERFCISLKELDKFGSYWMSYHGDEYEELVFDIWLYYKYNSDVAMDLVKKLFGIPVDTKMIKEAYSVDYEGSVDQNYFYQVNVALIPGEDAAHPHRIHISPVIYRRKSASAGN